MMRACMALGCAMLVFADAVSAQSYPAKPIRVLIATSAGSNPDTVARIAA